ncbi:zinc finger protein 862-like [Hydra vulgaris]|uniref:zinc finger protein 862-like n=1 Tax=Hydra vulgaris TaxID=6087 RepID=UPI0032EA30F1
MDCILKNKNITLKTFKSWDFADVFQIETVTEKEKIYVIKIICTLCKLHQNKILSKTNGAVRAAALRFINGTNYVKKDSICRHLSGATHQHAIQLENEGFDKNDGVANSVVFKNLSTSSCLNSSALKEIHMQNSYRNLVKIAYEMACHPTMPHAHFSVLVRCAKITGASLIKRNENGRTCREMIKCCADSVREKCFENLQRCNFFSILSDGSQTRKTGKEKELVLVRTDNNGVPIYMVTELLDMSLFGGSNSNSVTIGINSIFESDKSLFKLSTEDYTNKVICATADGASVNFGIHKGVLSQLQQNRPWLIKVHCINHRIELAVKDAFKEIPDFIKIDEFYIANYYLLRNSGKLKAEVEAASKCLGLTHYNLPKITGTRFVGHRRRGVLNLLETWPAFIMAYQNYVSEQSNSKTVTKVKGLLKSFKCHSFLYKVGLYLDSLEVIIPASKIFETNELLAHKIPTTISRTLLEIEDKIKCIGQDDEFIDSFINRYFVTDKTDVEGSFAKAGDKRKHVKNRKYISVILEMNSFDHDESIDEIRRIKKNIFSKLYSILSTRFQDYSREFILYRSMKIIDPIYWIIEDPESGVQEINYICNHFEAPLKNAGFQKDVALTEWKKLKRLVKTEFDCHPVRSLWKIIFKKYFMEYRNLCCLMSLIMCISGSNSEVERTFSTVTNILSDKRLSLSHEALADCVVVLGNQSQESFGQKKTMMI